MRVQFPLGPREGKPIGDGSGLENRRGASPWGFDSLPSRLCPLGGRLTVGHLALDQAMGVRLPPMAFQ
jgi:hypothetical protein